MVQINPFIIRCVALSFVTLGFIFVAIGEGICNASGCTNDRLSVNKWHHYKKIGGQYVAFIGSAIVVVSSLVVIVMLLIGVLKQKKLLIIFDVVMAFACLIFGILEIYYLAAWELEPVYREGFENFIKEQLLSIFANMTGIASNSTDIMPTVIPYTITPPAYKYVYNRSWATAAAFFLASAGFHVILPFLIRVNQTPYHGFA